MRTLNRMPQQMWAALSLVLASATASPAVAAQDGVSSGEIVALVEQTISRQLGESPLSNGATRIEVVAGALDSRLRFDACDHPIAVDVDLSKTRGRVSARLSCSAPSPWSLYVPTEIRIYRPVVVSSRDLARNEVLKPADIMLAERDILAPGSPTLPDLQQAIGLNLRRSVSANTVLVANMLEKPVMVHRGDQISISAQAGGVAVRAAAEAMENGRAGERIRVKNLRSGKIVEATITGAGQAQTI